MTSRLDLLTASPEVREREVRALLSSSDQGLAARVLGLLPGFAAEKQELVNRIVGRDPASPDVLPLIRHLPQERLSTIAAESTRHPERIETLLEVARHAPAVVRPLIGSIKDGRVVAAARAEAPDTWVKELA